MLDVFTAFHHEETRNLLANYYIGDKDTDNNTNNNVISDKENNTFSDSLRQLTEQNKGLFKADLTFYIYKLVSLLAILASSSFVLSRGYFIGSAILLGLFWQQCGWLAHDFAHHQVFQDRMLNNLFGIFIGNFLGGYSLTWWKGKHNVHHSLPNTWTVDTDINTLPYLAWS